MQQQHNVTMIKYNNSRQFAENKSQGAKPLWRKYVIIKNWELTNLIWELPIPVFGWEQVLGIPNPPNLAASYLPRGF